MGDFVELTSPNVPWCDVQNPPRGGARSDVLDDLEDTSLDSSLLIVSLHCSGSSSDNIAGQHLPTSFVLEGWEAQTVGPIEICSYPSRAGKP